MKGKEKESTKLLERNEETGHKRQPQQTLNPAYIRKKVGVDDSKRSTVVRFEHATNRYTVHQYFLAKRTLPTMAIKDDFIKAAAKRKKQLTFSHTSSRTPLVERKLACPYEVPSYAEGGNCQRTRQSVFTGRMPSGRMLVFRQSSWEKDNSNSKLEQVETA
ncbi:hypothetical protein LOAG_12556 [Loa loa]|uniref:Uncharacterized protein n=1 Tax=Loa loa TaxID=7209 RepID=A0A1S0TL35_LOALO|nr:hypothetical protein LOAG_12556 [Loa loa]EFO15953.1 hypothetical protein LOAG_12556 [Loa loa]